MTQTPTEYVVDFPVMWVAIDWTEAHAVVPDGWNKGDPFLLTRWQTWFFANHYRIRVDAPLPTRERPAIGAPAFFYRRSQCVMPQKAGKGPMTAAQVCLEGMGPAMFAGWASGGEEYRCRDWGCPCGWVYRYAAGEPMGVPWPTPLIQITAFSEEQTANVYKALRPMVEGGPLANVAERVGEAFMRLPNDGMVDTVTSSNQSRLGQRVTYVPQDETGIWTPTNKMTEVAKTQRRGLAGMQGRSTETTNGWDPSENSVAQQTALAALSRPDIFRLHRLAPANLSFGNKRERRRILKIVYDDCPWVDLDAIEAEALELMLTDPANAERFFANRIVAGAGAWLPDGLWESRQDPRAVAPGTPIALGFDGSDSDDWTALRAETIDGHRFTPLYGPDRRPTWWNPAQWGGSIPRDEVHAAVDEVMHTYDVRRLNGDPPDWRSELGEWAQKYGEEKVREWPTYRIIPMHAALVRALADLKSGRSTVDLDPLAMEHANNARKAAKAGDRYLLAKPDAHRKIDIVMADTLAHEAAAELHAEGKWAQSRYTYAVGAAYVG